MSPEALGTSGTRANEWCEECLDIDHLTDMPVYKLWARSRGKNGVCKSSGWGNENLGGAEQS